jgi:hypothetical protein
MHDAISIRIDLFAHDKVGDHVINACCFGEDFAEWLRQRLSHLDGIAFSEPIQEDYGWGLWATYEGKKTWIALSYSHAGPVTGPADWVVTVDDGASSSLLARLCGARQSDAFPTLRDAIWTLLGTNPAVEMLPISRN